MLVTNDEIPEGIEPPYRTEHPNQQVLVYEGETQVEREGQTLADKCAVYLKWAPSLGFDMEMQPAEAGWAELAFGSEKSVQHKLQNGMVVDSFVRSMRIGSAEGTELAFALQRCWYGNEERCGEIVFHITNFHDYVGRPVRYGNEAHAARLQFTIEPWVLTLDAVSDERTLRDMLRREGGFALTHVGRLARSDGKPFVVSKGRKLLDAFLWFLWFCRGTFVGIPIMIGLDKAGDRKFELWANSRATPFKHVSSWFPDHDPESIERLFESFCVQWANASWRETLKYAIHWYVVANLNSAANEGSIALAQMPLERLSWSVLVERKRALSQEGFTRLPAADQLSLFLTTCGISTEIPKALASLRGYALGGNLPQVLTSIRNLIVHPVRKAKAQPSDPAMREAMEASLWCLEVALLGLLDYQGSYRDRLSGNLCGPMKRLPESVMVETP